MNRFLRLIAIVLFLALPGLAQAKVMLSFQSFTGSLTGRYPHAFIVMKGTLDKDGRVINENYGFSAKSIGPKVLLGPVRQWIYVEKQKYVDSTNRHITIPISDETYHEIVAETYRWRDLPEHRYDMNHNNCVHYVARIAQLSGLKADVPQKLAKSPREWLNYVVTMNPQVHGKQFN